MRKVSAPRRFLRPPSVRGPPELNLQKYCDGSDWLEADLGTGRAALLLPQDRGAAHGAPTAPRLPVPLGGSGWGDVIFQAVRAPTTGPGAYQEKARQTGNNVGVAIRKIHADVTACAIGAPIAVHFPTVCLRSGHESAPYPDGRYVPESDDLTEGPETSLRVGLDV